MIPLALDLVGEVLYPNGDLCAGRVSMCDGAIVDARVGRTVDLEGYLILPGIVDVHGDGFERHVAPRRGAMKDVSAGLRTVAGELALNGVTTAILAQFWSWEGGLRGPDFAAQVFEALAALRATVATDMRGQLRFETHMLQDYTALPDRIRDWVVEYVVFNDHLPHDRLSDGRTPRRLTGQALKAGRSPEAHHALMRDLHSQTDKVPAALDALCATLSRRGLRLGSHDDRTPAVRQNWHARGVDIAEFPETMDAAKAARDLGNSVVMGAPNVMRGGSHNGNLSALDLIAAGGVDALASDYHYPALCGAVGMLTTAGVTSLAQAWELISSGPAAVLGLQDRGTIAPGQRADIVVVERTTLRVCATLAAGVVTHMNGDVAARFVAQSV